MRALEDSFSANPVKRSQFKLKFEIGKTQSFDFEEKGLAWVKRFGLAGTHSCMGAHKNEPGCGY
jgi:hypothetical protein